MGQYFKPCVLAEDKQTVKSWIYSHNIKYKYKRSDGSVVELGNGLKLMEHSYLRNEFVQAFESLILNNPKNVVWAGDYAEQDAEFENNVYNRCQENTETIPSERPSMAKTRFIVNHTKKQYVDKYKVPGDKGGFKVHPLPLLTSEGNGQGGGDYRLENPNIGIWARDLISVQSKKPKGYTELIPNFIMD
jgi:hypothetical protein